MSKDKGQGGAKGGQETIIRLRVQPRASRNDIRLTADGSYRVAVTSPPVDDAANEAVCALLAKHLGVPKRDLAIVSGAHSRNKSICIRNMSAAEIMTKMAAMVNE